jgi:hypothetical protein
MRGRLRLHAGAPRGRADATRRRGAARPRRLIALAASLSVLMTLIAAPSQASAATIRPECLGPANSVAVADALLDNRYKLASFPTVTLPSNPKWTENPLKQVNWLFNYHSLRFVWALTTAWAQTGEQRYLDRAKFLLYDWQRDNPRVGAPSPWSWNDHATAWRAMVYVCAAEILPDYTWLLRTLRVHGETLASPSFYRAEGNHALNQDIGLLEVGHFLGRSDWKKLAASRVAKLVTKSVDTSGVINEQSVFYQLYNYDRYGAARKRLRELKQPVGSGFARVDLMPAFLAHATYPDGRYVPIGDTEANKAAVIPGTWAEFAATGGTSGPKPSSTSRVYGAGYAFVRTGWGEDRPYEDETMLTMRFGPGRRFHGHDDGSSITLYGYGAPVILDSGMFTINPGPYRNYFVSRRAHNVVTVDGLPFDTTARTDLRWKRQSSTLFELAVKSKPYAGVASERRVTFSKSLGYAIVDDRLTASSTRTFRQLWHLRNGSSPVRSGTRTWTRADRSNVLIVQVIAPSAARFITGATSPIQGWVSFGRDEKAKAPVLESRRGGTKARFLTLLVPYETTRPNVSVTNVKLYAGAYAMTVTINGHRERVQAGYSDSRITPLS